jgi:hypothetical protein
VGAESQEACQEENPMPTTRNLTPYTFYCEYCGARVKPGAEHECEQKYEEESDDEEKGD